MSAIAPRPPKYAFAILDNCAAAPIRDFDGKLRTGNRKQRFQLHQDHPEFNIAIDRITETPPPANKPSIFFQGRYVWLNPNSICRRLHCSPNDITSRESKKLEIFLVKRCEIVLRINAAFKSFRQKLEVEGCTGSSYVVPFEIDYHYLTLSSADMVRIAQHACYYPETLQKVSFRDHLFLAKYLPNGNTIEVDYVNGKPIDGGYSKFRPTVSINNQLWSGFKEELFPQDRTLDHERKIRNQINAHGPVWGCQPSPFEQVYSHESIIGLHEKLFDGNYDQYLKEHKKMSFEDFLFQLDQLLHGLSFLHEHDIIHRDLHTKNILCLRLIGKRLQLFIADFGCSTSSKHPQGPYYNAYISPRYEYHAEADQKARDVFCMGIIAIYALTKKVPYTRIKQGEDQTLDVDPAKEPPELDCLNKQVGNLLRSMIHPNPARRIKAPVAHKLFRAILARDYPRLLQEIPQEYRKEREEEKKE